MSCNRIYPFDYCCDDSSVESASNNVEANPADEATERLNKLKVDEVTYSVANNASVVEANPTDEATETLEKVKIDDVTYSLGGGGSGNAIKTKSVNLHLNIDYTDITTADDILVLQMNDAGNAKIDAFVDGIIKNNVISLYCTQWIFNGGEILPDNTPICNLYGTFDIPAIALNENMMGLSFPYDNNGRFVFAKIEGQWRFGFFGSAAPSLLIHPQGIELYIFYL